MVKKIVSTVVWLSVGFRGLYILLLIAVVAAQDVVIPLIFSASALKSEFLVPWPYMSVIGATALVHVFLAIRLKNGGEGTAIPVLGIVLFGGVNNLILSVVSMADNIVYTRLHGAESVVRYAGVMSSLNYIRPFSAAANTLLVVACAICFCLAVQRRDESLTPGHYQPYPVDGNLNR